MYRTCRTTLALAALAALTIGALHMSARAFAQADAVVGSVETADLPVDTAISPDYSAVKIAAPIVDGAADEPDAALGGGPVRPLPKNGTLIGCTGCVAITTYNQLYNIDVLSGTAPSFRTVYYGSSTGVGYVTNFVGIARKPGAGLYGLTGSAGMTPYSSNRLFELQITSNSVQAQPLGPSPLKLSNNTPYIVTEGDIAIEPTPPYRLYGISTNGSLFRVDNVNTSIVTPIGTGPVAGMTDVSALAFSKSGDLYALGTVTVGAGAGAGKLFKINKSNIPTSSTDPVTGTLVNLSGFPVSGAVAGMTFGETDTHLYAVVNNRLARINPTTGVVTVVGPPNPSFFIPSFAGFTGRLDFYHDPN